jgi:hypothetical protein
MKGIIKYSIAVFTITLAILSCQKQIDYGPDIALLKSDVASLKSSITTITAQLTSLEASLKAKIDLTNSKIDTINSSLATLNNKTLLDLSNSIKAINTSITNTNDANKKTLDSLKTAILSVDSALIYISTSSPTTLTSSYNKILSNYIGILQIVKSTLAVVQIDGSVFKGSFLRGSLLNFYELDSNLNQTGRSFNSTIKDDYGNFTLKAQNLTGKLVRVVGDGFYWNEVLNENSSSRITLTALCKIDSNETVNVNVLTHLERPRVEYLYNTKGLSFDSAKSQAVKEVLKAFGFENTGIKRAEKVGVVGVGDDSKILLAISTLMQGYRTESEVTQILSDFSEDLEKDGTLTDVSIGNDLEAHLYYVDTAIVLSNFKTKYRKLYNADTVNSVDMRFVKNFQNNTAFVKDKDLFEFPVNSYLYYDSYGAKNILNAENTIFTTDVPRGGVLYFSAAVTTKRKGLNLKVVITDENGNPLTGRNGGCFFSNPLGFVKGWQTTNLCNSPTYITDNIGLFDTMNTSDNNWGFTPGQKIKINFYERGFTTPSRFKIVTFN